MSWCTYSLDQLHIAYPVNHVPSVRWSSRWTIVQIIRPLLGRPHWSSFDLPPDLISHHEHSMLEI